MSLSRKERDHLAEVIQRENEMVLNASDDLGVSKEKLDNIINKSNITAKSVIYILSPIRLYNIQYFF